MPARLHEIAGGLVDGVNRLFSTSASYRPFSLTVQVNGQAIHPDEVTETGHTTLTLVRAPKAPGVVTVRYTAVF